MGSSSMLLDPGCLFFIVLNVSFLYVVKGRIVYAQHGQHVALPAGPWIDSARDVELTGNRLCAQLRRMDGTRSRQCVAVKVGEAFSNSDGRFLLEPSALPGGSWLQTMKDPIMSGGLLCADLRRDDLTWAEDVCVVHEEAQYFENIDGRFRLQEQPCLHLEGRCVHGYILRFNVSATLCDWVICEPERDRDTCCEPAEHCGNITTCQNGSTPHPDKYCPAVVCDQVLHRDGCCVHAAPCETLYLHDKFFCLDAHENEGYVLKNDTQRFCDGVECIVERDRENCCESAAPCTDLNHSSCPNGFYFNASYSCGGAVCDEERDRMVCCQVADPCSNLTCPFGFLAKPPVEVELPWLSAGAIWNSAVNMTSNTSNASANLSANTSSHLSANLSANASMSSSANVMLVHSFCDGVLCQMGRDRDFCCDAASPCANLSCPYGFVVEPSPAFCGGTSCDLGRDFEACCRDAALCADISFTTCVHGEYFNDDEFCDGVACVVERDAEICCQEAASCDELACPVGYLWKANVSAIFVDGAEVELGRDRDICCDVAAPCSSIPLFSGSEMNASGNVSYFPVLGYIFRPNPETTYCLGTSCLLERDLDVCAEQAALCTDLGSCPHGFVMHVGKEWAPRDTAFCAGASCDAARDYDVCCYAAAPCEDVQCPHSYVTVWDTYCLDSYCNSTSDTSRCCQLGISFRYYRYEALEVRLEPNDGSKNVLHLAEVLLYYHDVRLSMDGAVASAVGGASPRSGAEDPQMAIDGLFTSKWLDDLRTPLTITLPTAQPIDSYSFATANDATERDPLRFQLEGSEDGIEWTVLHDGHTGCPEVERAETGEWIECLDRQTEIERQYIWTPCRAPEGASCSEGSIVASGSNCTVSCPDDYVPSLPTMACNMGHMTPETASCYGVTLFDAIPCPHGYVSSLDPYCLGPDYVEAEDLGRCCERGVGFRYFRFETLELRGGDGTPLQIAEILLYSNDMRRSFANASAAAWGGDSPPIEGPANTIDGILSTKWNDDLATALTIEFPGLTAVDSYSFVTANDVPERDPLRFRLEGSLDNSSFVLLHEEQSTDSDELPRLTESPRNYVRTPCRAPIGLTCVQGEVVADGQDCNATCASGLSPSEAVLSCSLGVLSPDTWTCA